MGPRPENSAAIHLLAATLAATITAAVSEFAHFLLQFEQSTLQESFLVAATGMAAKTAKLALLTIERCMHTPVEVPASATPPSPKASKRKKGYRRRREQASASTTAAP